MSAALPCIVCASVLDGTFLGEDVRRNNQPSGGCAFSSPGHYGTTVFDPMNGDTLEINVCDRCLVRAGQVKAVLHHRFVQPKHHRKDTFWTPPASAIEARRAATAETGAARWWAGDNDEFYRVGPCRTRDEALGEAWAYFGDDRKIHLLQASLAAWPAPSAASVIDMMVDNSDELFLEDGFTEMDGTEDAVAEAEADLDRALTAWLDKWRNIFPSPTSFGWVGEREVVPASAIEAPSGEETGHSDSTEGKSAVPNGETPDV